MRINSPHYLVKITEDLKGPISYTLVLSQYEKSTSIYYSLRAYSTIPFELNELKDLYNSKYSKDIVGKWAGKTAGGCTNYQDTYKNNPVYQIELNNNEVKNCVKIELKGPQQYSVGFEVVCMNKNTDDGRSNSKFSTGDYRKGFCVLALENISGGKYHIRPTTFYQNQEGPFFLSIQSSHPFQISQLQ